MPALSAGRATLLRPFAAAISSADPAVQVLDGVSTYGDLEAGDGLGGDGFLIRYADASLNHPLLLTVSDQRGTVLTRTVNIGPPSAPVSLTATGRATSIDLKWAAAVGGEVGGYNIFRSSSQAGPFVKVNDLPTDRVAYYRDEVAPFVAERYRVLSGREHTATCGSSLGGLFSIYIAWQHSDFARHHAALDYGVPPCSRPCPCSGSSAAVPGPVASSGDWRRPIDPGCSAPRSSSTDCGSWSTRGRPPSPSDS